MKRSIFTLTFLFSGLLLFAQEPKSAKQIKNLEKGNLKTTNVSKANVNPDKEVKNSPVTSEESNIILKLEYKQEENINPSENKVAESNQETQVYNQETEIAPVRTIDEQIQIQEELIKSIDRKVNISKNDPEADKKAIETGWYNQMEKNKVSANKKLDELINSKK